MAVVKLGCCGLRNGVLGKMFGLMFSKRKKLLFALGSSKRVRLHMFFVFFPVNVYFLDENRRVIEIKYDFRPFTFYTSKKQALYFVESPEKLEMGVGDVVEF